MVIKQLYHFFHKLRVSVETKQSSFVVSNFIGLEKVLVSLFKMFLIFGYKPNENNDEIEVFLKYDCFGNPIFKEINWFVKGSVQYSIPMENIVIFKKKYSYSNGFVLTRKGVLDFQGCVEKKVTGVLLVILK